MTATQLRAGSLFSGYGGLDLAVEAVFGATTAWHAEVDAAPSKILAARWPGVPNLGDVTTVDWSTVEPVDIIAGGSPCQDVSHAGKRAGMRAGTRSGLWASMCDAIEIIRPRFVVWENVRGVLSAEADSALEPCPGCVGDGDDGPVLRALGRVLGDLAELGFDARWYGLRAADVGAPHGRFRIFVVAADATREPWGVGGGDAVRAGWGTVGRRPAAGTGTAPDARREPGRPEQGAEIAGSARGDRPGCDGPPTGPTAKPDGLAGATAGAERGELQRRGGPGAVGSAPAEAEGARRERQRHGDTARHSGAACGPVSRADVFAGRWCACEPAPDADRDGREGVGRLDTIGRDADRCGRQDRPRAAAEPTAWGQYGPAIRRWEHTLGRVAPAPTERAPRGGQRLSPRFVEWMMGLPDGWVTDVPGTTRNEQLRALGNGVVPLQAEAALRAMLNAGEVAA